MLNTIAPSSLCVPDHTGPHYSQVLERLHEVLQPKSYFEIGTLHGDTLMLARCASISVDPQFNLSHPEIIPRIVDKPSLMLFQKPSDDFFAMHDPEQLLGAKIDFAFLDGMHRCEFLLRDFINTERFCKPNSLVVLHDCLPCEPSMTARTPASDNPIMPHRRGWWTGDVWRTSLLLKRVRPDLSITALDAQSTGLLLITNLNPASTILTDGYDGYVKDMLSWKLEDMGIPALFDELGLEPASNLELHEDITARFWL